MRSVTNQLETGGVRTLMYGGNANFYHLPTSEYAATLDFIAEHGTFFDPNIDLVFRNYFENKAHFIGIGNYTESGYAYMERGLVSFAEFYEHVSGRTGYRGSVREFRNVWSDFFDGYHDDNIYFNSPYEYLPNMPDPWKYNHMNIILGTGEWDNTRHESMRLSDILNSKGIRHWLDDRKWCGHEWKYWRDMLPYYLSPL